MWPWIYRIIAAVLALTGAALLAAAERALREVGRHAGEWAVQIGAPAALAAGAAALILILFALVILASPAGRASAGK